MKNGNLIKDGNLVVLAGGISSRMKKSPAEAGSIDKNLLEDAEHKTKAMIGVGGGYRPFLDYLLFNAREAGYYDIVIVIGENDSSIRQYYGQKDNGNEFHGLSISYAVQKIPAGRVKPLGTADALLAGMEARKNWSGQSFTVCNSDNLYSVKALQLIAEDKYQNAMIDYSSQGLEFEKSRIGAFAVVKTSQEGFLEDIIEKPAPETIKTLKRSDGAIGTSMNIFRLDYDMIYPLLLSVPLHPVRLEKELPEAVKQLAKKCPGSVFAYPLCEHVPDLTNKSDILPVKKYLESHYKNAALFDD